MSRLNDLGFPVSIDLLHSPSGRIEIGAWSSSGSLAALLRDGHALLLPGADYGARLLQGQRPDWKCRAGSRFLYVDEFGTVQFCSAQRGRPGKPLLEYTREDARQHHGAYKGCESGCSLLCHYRDSALDNHPLHTVTSMIGLLVRRPPAGIESGGAGAPAPAQPGEVGA